MSRLMMLAVAVMASSACAAPILSVVRPEGDGQRGKDRWGWGSWYDSGFDSAANPNWSGHWYNAPDGQWRAVSLQVALPTVNPASIQQATLNLHVTEISGSGSSLNHVTNSAAATGLASQELAGDVMVMDLLPEVVGTGWLAVDVTEVIRQDLANGAAWAAFSLPNKGYSSLTFDSAENTSGLGPYLSVTLVPEPAGLCLLGGALALWVRRGR